MARCKLSAEEATKISILLLQGKTTSQIAEALKVHRNTAAAKIKLLNKMYK